MLVKCCVPDCDSPPNVSYYSWPKEKKNSAEWCTLVFKSMDIPANMNKKLLVCAQHFSRDDYVNGLQAELLAPLGFTEKLKLKPSAIPSLLAKTPMNPDKEQRKKIIAEAIAKNPKSSDAETQTENVNNSDKKRAFTKEEMTTGLILRSMSTKAFNFIRSNNLLKLPSIRTQGKSI